MEANGSKQQKTSRRLLRILAAAEKARDIEDQVRTDRAGELLPNPADEPTGETPFRPRSARRAVLRGYHQEPD